MPRVLKLVDVGPNFGLPAVVMDGRFPACSAAGVQFGGQIGDARFRLQFDKNAANFLDVLVLADQVFVTQKVSKTKLVGLALGLSASMKWAIFGNNQL